MWKKTFIRSSFIGLVILAALAVFASTSNKTARFETEPEECSSSSAAKEACEKKAQADFIIWESLGKTVVSYLSY